MSAKLRTHKLLPKPALSQTFGLKQGTQPRAELRRWCAVRGVHVLALAVGKHAAFRSEKIPFR
jgi:hypothetical protein